MQPFRFALIGAGIMYTILYDAKFFFLFLGFYGVMIAFNVLYPAKYNNIRKKITIATWKEPAEGNIHGRYEVNTSNLDKWCEEVKQKHGIRINTTHATIKACGEVLKNCPELNGKIVFGKYIPYDTVNVSCLIDIDAKDLASITIENVDKMTLEELAQYLSDKAKTIKVNKGDAEHKQKLGIAKLLPAPVPFIACLGVTKKCPIVENDKIVIAPIAGVHITGDHRYIDGARASALEKYFKDVFDHPEKYSKLKTK